MKQINIGDNAASAPPTVRLGVQPGQSINVSNLAGSATVTYFSNGLNAAGTTIAAGSSASVTGVAWLQSAGVSTLILNGGPYGP